MQIDDRLLHAAYGLETPWVANAIPDMPGAAQAGYNLRLDTSTWEPGTRKVTIAAFDGEGRRGEIAGEIRLLPFDEPKYSHEENVAAIAEGDVAMWLEEPRIVEGECQVEGPVEVSGWAHAASGIEAVIINVDGRSHYQALRPIVRPDLLDAYGPAVAGEAGFALRLHSRECPPGRHRLTVVAVGGDGSAVGVEGNVVCAPEPPPLDPPALGESVEVEWIGDRRRPRERDDSHERYDPEQHAGLALEAEHQLRYRWAMQVAEGRIVLDAGCGVGWGAALLAQAGAEQVVGLDISEEALAVARSRTVGIPVEFQQGDLQALPFEDATFDLITCFEAIEHVADPGVALEELRRVLRPEGVLLLVLTKPRRPSRRDDARHLHEFTLSELKRALRDCFANVQIHYQQTCMASVVLDDEALAIGDGTTDLGVQVRKLTAGRPGGQSCLVAVAGDASLPDLGRMAALASSRAVERLHEMAYTWEDRALRAEADAAASRVEANLAQMHQKGTARLLVESTADAHAAHALITRMRFELDEASTELTELRSAHADSQRRWEAQELELTRRATELNRRAVACVELDESLRSTEERLRSAEGLIAAQQSSLSWLLTRPLRFVKRTCLRAFRGRDRAQC